jgi:prepilin-type processing-associated H-X9-DG protein
VVPLFFCPSRRTPDNKNYSLSTAGTAAYVTVDASGNYSSTATTTPIAAPFTLAKTDYAACAGSNLPTNPLPSGGSLANGELPGNGVSYHLSQVRPQDITRGLSNTIFASEKYMDSFNYLTGTAQSDNNSAMDGYGTQQNRWVTLPPMKDDLYFKTHGQFDDPSSRFGSCHTEGMNTALCDGSVALINFAVDSAVLGSLGVRTDSSNISDTDLIR